MRRSSGLWVLSVAVGALGGCGSPAKVAPATATAACMQLHAAEAARSVRCSGGSLDDWEAYWDGQDDCAAYDTHVADGQAEYRPQGWDACLNEYAAECGHVVSFCFWEILHGLVADGQHCQDTGVCGTQSICAKLNPADPVCGSVCMRAGNENEACGFYCGGSTPCNADLPICTPPLACVNNVCVKAKGPGASCGAIDDPVPCASYLSCHPNPVTPTSTGICKGHGPGDACTSDSDCIGTEFCNQGMCMKRRALGESCASEPTSCVPWAACDANDVCVAAGRPGQLCAPFPGASDFLACAEGSCTGTTCTMNAHVAQSCAAGIACSVGADCDPSLLTCVACPP